MIDLDKIERQCKGAIENGYGHLPVLECGNAVKLMEVISRIRYAESETDAILSMLRHSEKDAARYRWLRDEARHHMDGAPLAFMTNYDGEPIAYPECGMVLHESYLDEAIDEAMQCK